MGARLLRQWLLRPLLDPVAIAARQDAVGALVEAPAERTRLRALLRANRRPRAAHEPRHARPGPRARPRRTARVPGAARRDPPRRVGVRRAAARGRARATWRRSDDLRELLAAALVDEPPLALHDGGLIRESWNEGLAAIVDDAARGAGVDRRSRGARAGAHRDLEPARPVQPRVRLRHRGDPRPDRARPRRVRAAADADRRRALRDAGAEGVRGEGARRRRAAPAARVRAVRGGAPARGGSRGGAPGDRARARRGSTCSRRSPRSPTSAATCGRSVDGERRAPRSSTGAIPCSRHARESR